MAGGEDWAKGMDCPAPTPQAGRVTVSVWGGGEDWGQGDGLPRPHATRARVGGIRAGGKGGTMPPCYMDLERLNFYIDYEAFKQWH